MARYSEADIINEVKVILTENENAPMLETEGMDDIALERDTLIAHLIPMAINRVLDVAPVGMLRGMEERYIIDDKKINSDETKVVVPITDNVLKVLSASVKGWRRQLHAFLTDESEEYELLHCRYPSWTPTKITPIGFLTYNDNCEEDEDDEDAPNTAQDMKAGRLLELMPGTTAEENKVKIIVLCRNDGADEDGYYRVSENCYPALKYMIAGMYYTSTKEMQMAQNMTAIAVDMLGQAAKAAEENS